MKYNRFLRALLVVFLVISMVLQAEMVSNAYVNIELNETYKILFIGDKINLKVVSPKNSKVTWKSDNKKVATVAKDGTVTAKGAGKATIWANIKGADSRGCAITVKSKQDQTATESLKLKAFDLDKKFCAQIKNNGKKDIKYCKIEVECYKKNKLVYTVRANNLYDLQKGETAYIYIDKITYEYSSKELEYDRVEVSAEAFMEPTLEDLDHFKVTPAREFVNCTKETLSNGVKIEFSNNGEKNLRVEGAVVYLKDGKVVDCTFIGDYLNNNESIVIKSKTKKKFDQVKIYYNAFIREYIME